jgi:hypothetical protein
MPYELDLMIKRLEEANARAHEKVARQMNECPNRKIKSRSILRTNGSSPLFRTAAHRAVA